MILEELRNFVATTASISTILQFLSGTLTCLKIVQNKTTGEISPFPFISGCLSTSLWLRYGFFIDDRSIILVNTIGASLFFAYVLVFLVYSLKKTVVIRQTLICAMILVMTLLYVHNQERAEDARRSLGLLCCVVTILFFAAPLASLLHVIRVKSTESLPLPIIFASFVTSVQWLLYGVILQDPFLKIPNFLGCVLSGFLLSLFCFYPKTPKDKGYSSGEFI